MGAAYETVSAASEKAHGEEITEQEIITYFQNRVKGKLLFLGTVSAQAALEKEQITLVCEGSKKGMRLSVRQSAAITCPEKELRKRAIIRNGLEDVLE